MKNFLLKLNFIAASFVIWQGAFAQTALVNDQNPNFAASRTKYMKMADSLNAWHSTTFQDTYKAIDWLADRAEARADRREFRRQLRLQRVNWDYDPYYRPSRGNRGYYNNNYNNRYYNRYNYGHGFWGLGSWWR
jgi:hypothetical protein